MSGITNPAEEYFKDGTWAWDPAGGKWLKLIIDPLTDHLMVDPGDDFEVHQTTPADMRTGSHGWDGAAWRKLPMVWGYYDVYSEVEAANDVGAGDATLTFSTVPDGEVWVVTDFAGLAHQDDPATVRLQASIGGTVVWLKCGPCDAAFVTVDLQGHIVLKKDDFLRVVFGSCLAGTDVRAYASGYKMKVAE